MGEMGVYSNDKDPAGMCAPRAKPAEPIMTPYTPAAPLPMASGCYVPGRIGDGMVDPQHCVDAHPHLADDAKPGLHVNDHPEGIVTVPPGRAPQPTPASQTWWGQAAGKAWAPIQSWFQSFGGDHDVEPVQGGGGTRS